MLRGSHIIAVGLSIVALLVSNKFSFAYTSAKFLGIALTVLVASFYVFEKKLSFFMTQNKGIIFSLLSLILFTGISLAVSKTGEPVTGVTLILVWALTAFAVSAMAKKEGVESFLKTLIRYQLPVTALIFVYLILNEFVFKNSARPFFGNPNIVSNFLAVSTLQLFFLIKVEKNALLKKAALTLAAISILLLVVLQSRGSFLGLIVGSLVFFYYISDIKQLFNNLKKQQRGIALTLIAILVLSFSFVLYRKGTESLAYRYSFWRNTLCLIKDHPLGVGPGAYEYVFQHYNGKCYPPAESAEGLQVRNPHNMFLEFFAEIGILGGLSFLAFLFFLFVELKKSLSKNRNEVAWVLGHAALIATIGFFEFPQDTPYTLLFISVLTGVALALIPTKNNPQSSYLRIINFSAAIIVCFIFFVKAYSDHLTLHPGPDRFKSFQTACALNKENWRGCVFLGLSYIENNEFEKLDRLIADLSLRFEGHHSLLHLKGTYAIKRGDIPLACEEFKKYHLMFDRKTSKKAFLEQNCPAF